MVDGLECCDIARCACGRKWLWSVWWQACSSAALRACLRLTRTAVPACHALRCRWLVRVALGGAGKRQPTEATAGGRPPALPTSPAPAVCFSWQARRGAASSLPAAGAAPCTAAPCSHAAGRAGVTRGCRTQPDCPLRGWILHPCSRIPNAPPLQAVQGVRHLHPDAAGRRPDRPPRRRHRLPVRREAGPGVGQAQARPQGRLRWAGPTGRGGGGDKGGGARGRAGGEAQRMPVPLRATPVAPTPVAG